MLLNNIPEKYFADRTDNKTIYQHLQRVYDFKKNGGNQDKTDYLKKLANGDIDANVFFKCIHSQLIMECEGIILFKNPKDSLVLIRPDQYAHELEHYSKAQNHGIISFVGIQFTKIQITKDFWDLKTAGAVVSLSAKRASEERWALKKYFQIEKDIAVAPKVLSLDDEVNLKKIESVEKALDIKK